MPSHNAEATELIQYAQSALMRAANDSKDSWRLPILITANEGRVVVLRAVDEVSGAWTFYTDRRTPKVAQLLASAGECSATFYHQEDRTQLRLEGIAIAESEAERLKIWSGLNARQKSSYAASIQPGSKIEKPSDGLSRTWSAGNPTSEEEESAFGNFVVYTFQIKQAELLLLFREGHRRCSWEGWTGDNFSWLVP